MGQISVKNAAPKGSDLSGNQHVALLASPRSAADSIEDALGFARKSNPDGTVASLDDSLSDFTLQARTLAYVASPVN